MRETRRWWRASEGDWSGIREGSGWCVGALGSEVVRDMVDVDVEVEKNALRQVARGAFPNWDLNSNHYLVYKQACGLNHVRCVYAGLCRLYRTPTLPYACTWPIAMAQLRADEIGSQHRLDLWVRIDCSDLRSPS